MEQNSSNVFKSSPKFFRNFSFDSGRENDNNEYKNKVLDIAKDDNLSLNDSNSDYKSMQSN